MQTHSIAIDMKRIGLVMALLIPALTGLDVYRSVNQIADSSKVDEATGAIRPFLNAAGHWALERGASRTAIMGLEPISGKLQTVIQERRRNGNIKFEEAMAVLKAGPDFLHKEQKIRSVYEAFEKVQSLRAKLDANFKKPLEARDASLGGQVVPTFSKLIEESQMLRRFYWNEMPVDGKGRLLAEVLDNAWVMAEYSGRERAVMGSLVSSSKVMDRPTAVTLAKFRARVEMAYSVIDLEHDEMPMDIQKSIDAMVDAFFVRYQETRDQAYAGSETGTYPFTSDVWISRATQAIETIIDLQMVSVDVILSNAASESRRAYMALGFDFILIVLGLGVLAYVRRYFNHKVLVPVFRITKAMRRVSEGEIEREIPYLDAGNEIGTMAHALDGFRQDIIEKRELAELEKQREIEAREERERLREEKRQEILALAKRFESSVGTVASTIMSASKSLENRAEGMYSQIERSKVESGSIVTASVQSSGNINAVAAAVEQFASTVDEINNQIGDASVIASEASKQVERAYGMIKGLDEMTKAVTTIVDLIRNITNQTNLLSLNANIEAANAGEAGKGFEIVAREIQGLARETAASTDKINAQIEEMQASTKEVVGVMEFMQDTIGRLNNMTLNVSSAVEQQSASTHEISHNLNEAAGGNVQVSSSIETVDRTLQETFDSINAMLSSSKEYGKLATELNTEVNEFLTYVKA